jgi:hypothetical protein
MSVYQNRIPKLLWLWLPIGMLVFQLALDAILPQSIESWVYNENGPYELAQVFIMIWAVGIASYILLKMDRSQKPLVAWIGLALICSIYVTGEEASWGQQFLHWSTPQFWMEVNDQGETNLHNTSSWLDQKPRLLLELGIYFGGIAIPLMRKYNKRLLPKGFDIISPSDYMTVTAVACLVIRLTDMIGDMIHNPIFGRAAELEETFLFYFVVLYLFEMKDRLVGPKGV